jgi:hypothetical protein
LRRFGRILVFVCVSVWCYAQGTNAPQDQGNQGGIQASTIRRPASAAVQRPAREGRPDAALTYDPLKFPRVEIPPPDPQLIRRAQEDTASNQYRRVNVGIHRQVAFTVQDGQWEQVGGSEWRWRLSITSQTALGIRLHLDSMSLPEGSRLFVFAPDKNEPVEAYSGKGPSAGQSFWSQILNGDTALLEIQSPSNDSSPPQIALRVSEVSHLFERLGGFGTASTCEVDASCYPAWAGVGDAVALIYGSWQTTFVCSGVMLNNLANDYSPMFLTAKHCFSDPTTANSAIVYWKYKTSSCNGTEPDTTTLPQTHGSLLLSMSTDADATLLLLTGAVPGDAAFAGWTTQEPALFSAITQIHHPHGSYRRYSLGNRQIDLSGYPNYFAINWNTGLTEPGSSGSPGFNSAQQVIGQLSAGYSECGSSVGPDLIAKFSIAYPDLNRSGDADILVNGLRDDAYAPNFTQETAATLPVPFPTTKLIAKNPNEDWFKVSLPPYTKVTVTAASASAMNLGHVYASIYGPLAYTTDRTDPFVYRSGSTAETPAIGIFTDAAYETYNLSVEVTPHSAPGVIASSTASVIATSGTFLGTIVFGGLPTNYSVEYSTDQNFGTYTTVPGNVANPPWGVMYSANDDQTGVGVFLGNLQPSTTYYARMVVTNDLGTTRGTPISFTTPALNLSGTWCCNSLSFSAIAGTDALTFTAHLYNSGNITILPDGATVPAPFTLNFNAARDCNYFSGCSFYVGFHPLSGGIFSGSLVVTEGSTVWTLPLTGTASVAPVLQLSVIDSMSNTVWVGFSSTTHFQISNPGVVPLAINSITVLSPYSAISDCPGTVAPGGSCSLAVTFHPTSAGNFGGCLNVSTNASPPYWCFYATGRDLSLLLLRPTRTARQQTSSGIVFASPATNATTAYSQNMKWWSVAAPPQQCDDSEGGSPAATEDTSLRGKDYKSLRFANCGKDREQKSAPH